MNQYFKEFNKFYLNLNYGKKLNKTMKNSIQKYQIFRLVSIHNKFLNTKHLQNYTKIN